MFGNSTSGSVFAPDVFITARIRVIPPPKGSRRLLHAQDFSSDGSDITVSTPGKALIIRTGQPITVKCYGVPLPTPLSGPLYCPESP